MTTKSGERRAGSRTSTRKNGARPRYSARTADKYELYQLAVQSADEDLDFVSRLYRRLRGRRALHLREDFCGTALLCATWAKRSADHTAEGYDLDPVPLAWGKEHNLAPLGEAAERVSLYRRDVRAKGRHPADIRLAQNFSYCIFQTRDELRDYFRRVYEELPRDGMFACDLYGGTEAQAEIEEERKIPAGFTYVWDQHCYLPGTSEYTCHIHFRFRDGTRMQRAFTYTWRLWTMPEIKELLREAGFRDVRSYFEQSNDDDEGEGNGHYALDETGESSRDCAGWVAYIVALK